MATWIGLFTFLFIPLAGSFIQSAFITNKIIGFEPLNCWVALANYVITLHANSGSVSLDNSTIIYPAKNLFIYLLVCPSVSTALNGLLLINGLLLLINLLVLASITWWVLGRHVFVFFYVCITCLCNVC